MIYLNLKNENYNIEVEMSYKEINNPVLYYNEEEMPLQEFSEELFNVVKLYNKDIKYIDNTMLPLTEMLECECEENNSFYYNYDNIIINIDNEEVFAYHCDFSSFEELKENIYRLLNKLGTTIIEGQI